MRWIDGSWIILLVAVLTVPVSGASAAGKDPKTQQAVAKGLQWLANSQSRLGHWSADRGQYPTAMTGLAGIALMCEGSTTTQGKYAPQVRRAVDYLVSRSRSNGLIGDPNYDSRYTYGHGFATLFLSQVVGEEEDVERRDELMDVLTRAVVFTGRAQTKSGGWGYVSAKDGNGFDEGSTTITQVQALRGCRNAGVVVPKEVIDNAITYIHKCTGPDGGVRYRFGQGGGGRPPITAAAIACLFNAGDYDSEYVRRVLGYCKKNLSLSGNSFGHWHYSHYYYSQAQYRQGGKIWEEYRDKLYARLVSEASADGSWRGNVGPVYVTAINLTIMQLEKGVLPIYQR